MKILYTTLHNPAYSMGGAEQILLDLAAAMKTVYHCEVAAAVNEGDLQQAFESQGIETIKIYWNKTSTLKTLAALKRAVETFNPDWIHAFHRYPAFLLEDLLGQKTRLLYTEEVLRQDKKFFFRYGRCAVACHETVRKNLVEYYQIPEGDTKTIANAVKAQRPDSLKLEELKKKYHRNPGEVWGLCIGRLEDQKGHRYLIEAVAGLPEAVRKKLKIFLAGDGSLEARLKTQVNQQGCAENLVFLGHTKRIPEWLALTDFMVLPSLWEGLPLSILEAYSAAKPVVATDIPGSRESVRHQETGWLVEAANPKALGQAIQHFASRPADVFYYGRQAYEWWQSDFSFEQMTDAYFKLYQNLKGRR